jgi:hypothetical protein
MNIKMNTKILESFKIYIHLVMVGHQLQIAILSSILLIHYRTKRYVAHIY